MKKVIITGGTGFIGKHLVNRLLDYGKYSIALVSNKHNFEVRHFAKIRSQEKVPLILYTADIRDKKEISKIFRNEKADTCIHLAAKISVADSIKNPDETMDINVNGTLNVLEACYNSGVKNFVFASSAAVYGNVTKLPISESQDLGPLSPYGASKMLAEEHVSLYRKLKKIENAVILRIFNVYGNRQAIEADVITRFVVRLSKGLPPIIFDDGRHTRDFISVKDVARAFLLSIRLSEQGPNTGNNDLNLPMIFNIGTGIPTSMNDLAKKMIEISGLDLVPLFDRQKVDSKVILHSYADMTKARAILHFVAKKAIDEGLREMINPMLTRK